MKVGPDTVIKRSSNVPWRTIEGKGILVDLDSGFYFSLNRTGQVIWGEIDGGKPLSAIARKVVDRFEVDEETALRDCLELAERMLEQGLVVTVSS
ncbi:MAG: PqqD family protein [Candidatus Eisenbacteria bacterium]|nr:PqqD family protein [Candidatus Eisenbacteria bacterium]